jgi:hypothetical protein
MYRGGRAGAGDGNLVRLISLWGKGETPFTPVRGAQPLHRQPPPGPSAAYGP